MIEQSLGEKIRELREKSDLSLREVARRLKVSPPFWSDVELGRRYPSDKMLEEISKLFNCPLEELRKYDVREGVAQIKKISEYDAKMAFAFRTVLSKAKEGLTPEEIVRRLNQNKK